MNAWTVEYRVMNVCALSAARSARGSALQSVEGTIRLHVHDRATRGQRELYSLQCSVLSSSLIRDGLRAKGRREGTLGDILTPQYEGLD